MKLSYKLSKLPLFFYIFLAVVAVIILAYNLYHLAELRKCSTQNKILVESSFGERKCITQEEYDEYEREAELSQHNTGYYEVRNFSLKAG